MGGLAPHGVIASMSLPAPELVDSLDMAGAIAIIAIIAGLLYAFTTLLGFWTSSARVLYGYSQLKQLPPGSIRRTPMGNRTSRTSPCWVLVYSSPSSQIPISSNTFTRYPLSPRGQYTSLSAFRHLFSGKSARSGSDRTELGVGKPCFSSNQEPCSFPKRDRSVRIIRGFI